MGKHVVSKFHLHLVKCAFAKHTEKSDIQFRVLIRHIGNIIEYIHHLVREL